MPTEAPEYRKIRDGADCCRNNGAFVDSTENNVAPNPEICMSLCDALDGCLFFSHAMAYQNCIFCSACAFTNEGSASNYDSYEKVIPTPSDTSKYTLNLT